MSQNIKRNADGKFFDIKPEQKEDLIQAAFLKLIATNRQIEQKTVILCRTINRLSLYRLLEEKIPSIQVVSYSEIIPDIYVEEIDRIAL